MDASQGYIVIAIVVLAVIAGLAIFAGRRRDQRLTPLAGLAFAFVLGGIIFGQGQWPGYGLMAIGVNLAVLDMLTGANRPDRRAGARPEPEQTQRARPD